MKPRVCVVSALYHPALGGLGRQAQLLTERLREEGVDLFVISRRMDFPAGTLFSPAVEVVRVPAPSAGKHILEEISVGNILISVAFSLGCLATLIRRRRDYEIVHFHGASIPLFLSLPFLKLAGKKVIAKVAAAKLGTEAGSLSGRYLFLGNVLAALIRHVDRFIAISDEIREGLLGDGVPPAGILRIANFIDPKTFYPPDPGEKERRKAEFGYAGKTLVLFSGRFVARKGVEYLLEAWRDLSPRFRMPACCSSAMAHSRRRSRRCRRDWGLARRPGSWGGWTMCRSGFGRRTCSCYPPSKKGCRTRYSRRWPPGCPW